MVRENGPSEYIAYLYLQRENGPLKENGHSCSCLCFLYSWENGPPDSKENGPFCLTLLFLIPLTDVQSTLAFLGIFRFMASSLKFITNPEIWILLGEKTKQADFQLKISTPGILAAVRRSGEEVIKLQIWCD